MIKWYLGGFPKKLPMRAAHASADSRIAEHPPAFYIQHGDKDPGVKLKQSVDFYEKLKASGYFNDGELVLHILKNAPHAGAGPEFLEPVNVTPIIDFFKKHMKE
jgi:dipeptidyl aminopeptidase/acylaminoacyl peptidase